MRLILACPYRIEFHTTGMTSERKREPWLVATDYGLVSSEDCEPFGFSVRLSGPKFDVKPFRIADTSHLYQQEAVRDCRKTTEWNAIGAAWQNVYTKHILNWIKSISVRFMDVFPNKKLFLRRLKSRWHKEMLIAEQFWHWRARKTIRCLFRAIIFIFRYSF